MVQIRHRTDETGSSPTIGRRVGGEIETVGVAPVPEDQRTQTPAPRRYSKGKGWRHDRTGSGLAARAAAWRDADPDPQTRAELDELIKANDTAALADRFDGSLAFGTAGIRAEIGAGPMRMNRLVAGRVAAGLARYITTTDPAAATAGVVVGYDGRTNSAVFATDAARILSRAGVRVSMLPGPLPTPVLAFAVRHKRASYGLMVTASHNPRQYNGIKVYVRDGGQLLPPEDEDIAAVIDGVDPLHLPAGWAEGPFEFASADESVQAYITTVASHGRPAGHTAAILEGLPR
jgi:phosphomannomutase